MAPAAFVDRIGLLPVSAVPFNRRLLDLPTTLPEAGADHDRLAATATYGSEQQDEVRERADRELRDSIATIVRTGLPFVDG
jgi:hypothetical protein